MSVLMVNESVDFVTLKELLDTTDGNLASHLNMLEKNNLIGVNKSFVRRKPNTRYQVTDSGRIAFREHLDCLNMLINNNDKGGDKRL